jgi:hypothetical protein
MKVLDIILNEATPFNPRIDPHFEPHAEPHLSPEPDIPTLTNKIDPNIPKEIDVPVLGADGKPMVDSSGKPLTKKAPNPEYEKAVKAAGQPRLPQQDVTVPPEFKTGQYAVWLKKSSDDIIGDIKKYAQGHQGEAPPNMWELPNARRLITDETGNVSPEKQALYYDASGNPTRAMQDLQQKIQTGLTNAGSTGLKTVVPDNWFKMMVKAPGRAAKDTGASVARFFRDKASNAEIKQNQTWAKQMAAKMNEKMGKGFKNDNPAALLDKSGNVVPGMEQIVADIRNTSNYANKTTGEIDPELQKELTKLATDYFKRGNWKDKAIKGAAGATAAGGAGYGGVIALTAATAGSIIKGIPGAMTTLLSAVGTVAILKQAVYDPVKIYLDDMEVATKHVQDGDEIDGVPGTKWDVKTWRAWHDQARKQLVSQIALNLSVPTMAKAIPLIGPVLTALSNSKVGNIITKGVTAKMIEYLNGQKWWDDLAETIAAHVEKWIGIGPASTFLFNTEAAGEDWLANKWPNLSQMAGMAPIQRPDDAGATVEPSKDDKSEVEPDNKTDTSTNTNKGTSGQKNDADVSSTNGKKPISTPPVEKKPEAEPEPELSPLEQKLKNAGYSYDDYDTAQHYQPYNPKGMYDMGPWRNWKNGTVRSDSSTIIKPRP